MCINLYTYVHWYSKDIVFYAGLMKTHLLRQHPSLLCSIASWLHYSQMFCFNCHEESPEVNVQVIGTLATVKQSCKRCQGYTWRSQPLIMGKYPAGNILLSFSVLMSGSSINKVLLLFKHLGLQVYSARTFFYHQRQFVFPVILKYWQTSKEKLASQLRNVKDCVWAGDGRFDSMGHSAKFGAYTMLNCNLTKIVHFELLQVSHAGHRLTRKIKM